MADPKDDVGEPSLFSKHMKPEISASRVSGGLDFEVFSTGSKHVAADAQSSDGMASVLPTPVKSDISTEIGLPLSSESFELDATKTHDLSAAEDGLNMRSHEPHQRTESSCSNSLSTILPVSFSNHSYQEAAFKEMCAFRNSVVSTDSSNTKGFDCRLEEPVTASSESGACHEQIISGESKDTLAVKAKLVEMGTEVATESQDTCVAGFDLNEDINANGTDDCIQTPAAMISSQGVIQVVAKAGRSNGQPKIPLKFDGRLDWKGTAETSAFRPANLSRDSERKTCSRNDDLQGFTGIDLNVAAVEDNSSIGMPMESCSEAGLKRFKPRPLIDLNCSSDVADEFIQPSVLPHSGNPPLVDMNLIQNARPVNNTDSANPRKHYYNFIGHDYFSNAHLPVAVPNTLQPVEFLHRIASMQPKLPFGSPSVNIQGYPPNSPVHFTSGVPLPSGVHFTGTVPVSYARYPGYLNPGMVHTSLSTPHLVQIIQEPGSNIPTSFPNLDVRNEENLSTNRTKMDEARQFSFMAPTGECHHRESWYDASLKRKEPEGRLRHYQLGYK